MKSKICRNCKQSLPLSSFTSTQARFCNPCRIIVKLEQRNAMMQRSLEKSKIRKPKTKTVASVPDLKATLQKLVNKYCKFRDIKAGLPCISCQKRPPEQGGHFWNMGNNSFLRFNEDNIHGQCVQCNKWEHGNLLNYRLNLVNKIGKERVEWLDQHHKDSSDYNREWLLDKIAEYKEKIAKLTQ